MKEKKKLLIVVLINLVIFGITNIMFNIKYEQVDDFIIYNLYSGLDGTYNMHGIYIHPVICIILSLLFRIIPQINWHSIFLLSMQFICFTLIGYTILKKHNNGISIVLYTIFASIFYSTLLMLIQYTSVAALLILTSFILLIDMIEQKENKSKMYKLLIISLFTLGIMTRMQSLLIIIPFMGIYFILYLIDYFKKSIEKVQIVRLVKYYLVFAIVIVIVYVSNLILYSNNVYKEYNKFNDARSTLHDIIYVDYEKNKEIFDQIGWSKNDHYMFYTFNFGDENIYSKENIEKILDYKIQKDGNYKFINGNTSEILDELKYELIDSNTYISIFIITVFIICLFNENKTKYNICIFLTTIAINILFIAMNRSMLRVVIPEYIIGAALLIYNLKQERKEKINDSIKNCVILIIISTIFCYASGIKYNFDYKIEDYKSVENLINYTSNNKENVYLYTVPSLQFRYLAYSVYTMPPRGAFSNLRVMGGWDMYTQNYYDFKERYNLEGNLLDLLKENVYLVDGDVYWSGTEYHDYKKHILYALKEHYNVEAQCKEIKEFDNLAIYKVVVNN